MAPIRFDENIKDKLEKRVLKPSPDAWDNLSSRLDKEEKKGNGKLFMWLGIAASLIGVLLFSTQLFDTSEVQVEPTVVEVEKTEPKEIERQNEISNDVLDLKLDTAKEEVIVKSDTQKTDEVTKSVADPKPTSVEKAEFNTELKSNTTEAVAVTNLFQKEGIGTTQLNQLDAESIKVLEVVAEIQTLTDSGAQVTDEELNALLKQAERELLKDKLYNETTKTVDANTLLQDVEEDLDQSFRAKVFDALNNGYDSVRTAVANRNN